MQVVRKCGRLGKEGIADIEAVAGWVNPTNRGPYDYQGVKPATAAIINDDRKEIVKELAQEFKLDGLWGEDQNEGGQGEEIEIQDWWSCGIFYFSLYKSLYCACFGCFCNGPPYCSGLSLDIVEINEGCTSRR